MVIPWFVVSIVELLAKHVFNRNVYVLAQGGPGWHRGRIGADKMFFYPRSSDQKPLKRRCCVRRHLKQHRG